MSRFTGNISVIDAKDAYVVVNSTSNILEFYANFTRSNYEKGKLTIIRRVGYKNCTASPALNASLCML